MYNEDLPIRVSVEASLRSCRVPRDDRGERTGNSLPGSGNSMYQGLEWARVWYRWQPERRLEWLALGGRWKDSGVRGGVGEGGGPDHPEPIGRVTKCPHVPTWN